MDMLVRTQVSPDDATRSELNAAVAQSLVFVWIPAHKAL